MKKTRNIFIFLLIILVLISSYLNAENSNAEKRNKQNKKEEKIFHFSFSPLISKQTIQIPSFNAPFEKIDVLYPGINIKNSFPTKNWLWMQMQSEGNLISGRVYSEYGFDYRLNLLKIFFIAANFNQSKIHSNSLLPYDTSFKYYVPVKRDIIETKLFKKFGIVFNLPVTKKLNTQINLSFISTDIKIKEKRNNIEILIDETKLKKGYEFEIKIFKKNEFFSNSCLWWIWIKIGKVNNNFLNDKVQFINTGFTVKKIQMEYSKNREMIKGWLKDDNKLTISYSYKFNF